MADDQLKTVQALNEALKETASLQKKAFAAQDLKAVTNLMKLETAYKNLQKAQESYKEGQDLVAKAHTNNTELTEEERKKVKQAAEEYEKASSKVTKAFEGQAVAAADLRAKQEEAWKQTTILGKTWGIATGQLGGYVKNLTFGALAMKALTRANEAAIVRQDILIKGYKKLDTNVVGAWNSSKGFVDTTLAVGKSLISGTSSVLDFSEAIRNAEKTAARLNISASEIAPTMEKFSRIVGSDSPKALGLLTEATLAVSKELGIDVAEATDYVSTRMDKFGGSATGALVTLHNLRKGAEEVNAIFGTTAVRADDVSRTLIEIGRNESIYAMDQRAISNVLRDNITRLQSMGESYDQAYKKAKLFTEGLTEKAPEWMKILAGQDITGQLAKIDKSKMGKFGDDAAEFLKTGMGQALEKAKPGLAKKVRDIYENPNLSDFDKSTLIQEITAGTTTGMNAVNDQILNLANGAGKSAVTVISKQFNVTKDQAYSMIESAREQKKSQLEVLNVQKMQSKEAAAYLGIKEEEFTADSKNGKLSDDQIQTLLRAKKLKQEGLDIAKADGKLQGKEKQDAIEKMKAQIKEIDLKKVGASAGQQALLEDQKQQLEVKLADTLGKTDEQQLDVLEQIRDEIKDSVPESPEGALKELIAKVSSLPTLIGAALTSLIAGKFVMGALKDVLIGSMGKGGGGIISSVLKGAGGLITKGVGSVVTGAGTLAEGAGTAASAIGGSSIAAGTAGVAAAGLAGYGVGKGINYIDDKTGNHMSNLIQSGMSMGSQLLGGQGIVSDADAMAQGAAMIKPRSPTALPGTFPSAATTPTQTPAQVTASTTASASDTKQGGSDSNSITGQVGALQPDGSVMVKLVNFMDAVGQGLVMAKQAVPRGPSK